MANERMLDKSHQPSDVEMLEVIGPTLGEGWTEMRQFLEETYDIEPVFNSGGQKYGWNLQYRKGGRPVCEMYPEYGSFTTLVILGSKELEQAIAQIDRFGTNIQRALTDTPRYHDGCWMYIRVKDPDMVQQDVEDIEQLILLKKKPPKKK